MPEDTEGSEHKPVGAVQPQHLLTTRGCLVFLGLELWVEFLASSLILICWCLQVSTLPFKMGPASPPHLTSQG